MFENSVEIFKDFYSKLGINKKKQYEANFQMFYDANVLYIKEIFDYVGSSDNKSDAAKTAAHDFIANVVAKFGKKDKLPKRMRIDLSLYMIYYLFPAILKYSVKDEAGMIADAIRDEWRQVTNNQEFNYATYDDIYSEFKEKLFGVF